MLKRYVDDEEILFGNTKVFFRDFAYSALLKKYSKYYEYINLQAHKLTNIFVKNAYVKKRDRKIKNRNVIRNYCRGFLQNKQY